MKGSRNGLCNKARAIGRDVVHVQIVEKIGKIHTPGFAAAVPRCAGVQTRELAPTRPVDPERGESESLRWGSDREGSGC